ncbi:MAG: hypothetical protein CMM92_06955 [Rickettsiales bacterium]|nr:hypothetical protein [Rickettsiales bacterium]|tara:strand:- start:5923 stop:6246 length:324 start_codon:yes stop_codon:yes gene_type:complete
MKGSTMFLLRKKNKFISKFIFFVVLFLPFWSKSLNVFEMSLIGIGSGVVLHQYFDNSLNKESQMMKKSKVIEKYYNSKKRTINSDEFSSMPIQEKLIIIEVYHSYNN